MKVLLKKHQIEIIYGQRKLLRAFLVDRLKKAHKMAIDKNWKVTDDASLFEMLNWKVKIIEGTYSNIKITSPIDLKIAKLFVKNS